MGLTPQLQSLITRPDNRELIRDQIAAIIKIELEGQRQMAEGHGLDSSPYRARVFVERADPWSAIDKANRTPIVSVWAENATFEKGASNVVSTQRCTGTFHIDVYGFGVSEDSQRGHTPADLMASLEAERMARNVRQILMSGFYAYLGFPQLRELPTGEQIVFGRWLSTITSFQPEMETRPVERVLAIRLDLEVSYNEFASEYQGPPLEIITLSMTKSPDGEIELAGAQLDTSGQ